MANDPKYIPFSSKAVLSGGITQTLQSHFLNFVRPRESRHLFVDLEDGDKLILEVDGMNLPNTAPILLLFHGLGGCSRSPYLLSIADAAAKEGIRTIRFNHRGCGPYGWSYAKNVYHSGRITDLLAAIKKVTEEFENTKILLCGFSLSANMLLNLLASESEYFKSNKNLLASLCVSPPIDLEKSSLKMSKGANRIFSYYFGRKLIGELKKLEKTHSLKILQSKKKTISLREFDRVYTAPLAEQKSRDEYYSNFSSIQKLANIRLSTTILYAKDDPIIDTTSFEKLGKLSSVKIEGYPTGGHMGFIHKTFIPNFGKRWMDYRIIEWVKSHI